MFGAGGCRWESLAQLRGEAEKRETLELAQAEREQNQLVSALKLRMAPSRAGPAASHSQDKLTLATKCPYDFMALLYPSRLIRGCISQA